jgi:hypothetical protein
MFLGQFFTREDLEQRHLPEGLAQLLSAEGLSQLISPDEIILRLFSSEELVNDLLLLDRELNAKERAILKAAIMHELSTARGTRDLLRRRIREVLRLLHRPSGAGEAE